MATRERTVLEQTLDDMRRASDAVDEANGTSEYQVRLVALALIARHYLRKLAEGAQAEAWRLDDAGQLDDVVVPDVEMFRLERMDDTVWWIGLYRRDGTLVHIDIVDGVATKRDD